MNNLHIPLTIGEFSVVINSPNTKFLKEIKTHYHNFLSPPQIDSQSFLKIKITHESLNSNDHINVTKQNETYTIDGGEFFATYHTSINECQAKMKAEKSVLDSFLRVLYSIAILKEDAFLIHSAGLMKENAAFIFAGQSSSGKTTTATVAKDCNVLNDELTLMRLKNNQFKLYATPFNGDYKAKIKNNHASLKKIFFLNKNLKLGTQYVEKTDALVKMLENVFFFDPSFDANQKNS